MSVRWSPDSIRSSGCGRWLVPSRLISARWPIRQFVAKLGDRFVGVVRVRHLDLLYVAIAVEFLHPPGDTGSLDDVVHRPRDRGRRRNRLRVRVVEPREVPRFVHAGDDGLDAVGVRELGNEAGRVVVPGCCRDDRGVLDAGALQDAPFAPVAVVDGEPNPAPRRRSITCWSRSTITTDSSRSSSRSASSVPTSVVAAGFRGWSSSANNVATLAGMIPRGPNALTKSRSRSVSRSPTVRERVCVETTKRLPSGRSSRASVGQ